MSASAGVPGSVRLGDVALLLDYEHTGSDQCVGCDAGARDGYLGAGVRRPDAPWGTRIRFAVAGGGCAVDNRSGGIDLRRCRSGDVVGGAAQPFGCGGAIHVNTYNGKAGRDRPKTRHNDKTRVDIADFGGLVGVFEVVPATGLEPVQCYLLEPESSASANSATRAT